MNALSLACMALTLSVYAKSMACLSSNEGGAGAAGLFSGCDDFLRVLPGHLGQRLHTLAGIGRVRAGRGAVHRAFHDALQDGGDAEHIIGEVEVPVVDPFAPGAPAVGGDVFPLPRYAQRLEIEPADAAELPRRNAPTHAVIGNIRQRMPQSGELPVEDGENSRLARG